MTRLRPFLTDEIKQFIRDHAHEGAQRLALQAKKYPDFPIAFIAQQIKGRRQVRKKLPTWHAKEGVVFPESISLEQCTSEQVAAFRSSLVKGERAADLTGGFGVDSYYLNKCFGSVDYVERNVELREIVEENFQVLGGETGMRFHSGNGIEWLGKQEGCFDLLYLDPARRDKRSFKVSALESCEPDIIEHWPLLLSKGAEVMVKTSPGLDIECACRQISGVESVYVLAVGSECKELLFRARKGGGGATQVFCVNLKDGGIDSEFRFTLEAEKACEGRFAMPERYLYEPNAAIMKAGPFKLLSERTGCAALGPRSRFYTSAELQENFPGRIFEVLDEIAVSRKAAKAVFVSGRANVISRNCGLSADDLRKKLKLADGGNDYAIGTRLANDARRVFRCRRLK